MLSSAIVALLALHQVAQFDQVLLCCGVGRFQLQGLQITLLSFLQLSVQVIHGSQVHVSSRHLYREKSTSSHTDSIQELSLFVLRTLKSGFFWTYTGFELHCLFIEFFWSLVIPILSAKYKDVMIKTTSEISGG